jgi:hypothetical protein
MCKERNANLSGPCLCIDFGGSLFPGKEENEIDCIKRLLVLVQSVFRA